MLEEIKQTPGVVIFGQSIFILTIIIFIASIINGEMYLANYAMSGVAAGCAIGVITTIMPDEKKWKFIVFDITATAILFISYVQVFAFR